MTFTTNSGGTWSVCSAIVARAWRRPCGVEAMNAALRSAPWVKAWAVLVHRERVLLVVALRPAAGGREGGDGERPAARRELQRDVAAERVADDVRFADPRLVHRPLDGFDERGGGDRGRERRAAEVAGQRRGEQRVVALEPRPHQLPHVRGAGEAVDQDQRRSARCVLRHDERRLELVGRERDVERRPAVLLVGGGDEASPGRACASGGRNVVAVDEVEAAWRPWRRPRACRRARVDADQLQPERVTGVDPVGPCGRTG